MSKLTNSHLPKWLRWINAGVAISLFVAIVTNMGIVPFVSANVTFTMVFTPDTIGPGSVSTLAYTITNAYTTPVTDIAFTGILTEGLTIATPANANTDCPGATLDASAGGTSIVLSNGQLSARCFVRGARGCYQQYYRNLHEYH